MDALSKRSAFLRSSGIGFDKKFDATPGFAVCDMGSFGSADRGKYYRLVVCLPLRGKPFSVVENTYAQYMPGPLGGYDVSFKFKLPKTESIPLQSTISSWLQTVLDLPRMTTQNYSEESNISLHGCWCVDSRPKTNGNTSGIFYGCFNSPKIDHRTGLGRSHNYVLRDNAQRCSTL